MPSRLSLLSLALIASLPCVAAERSADGPLPRPALAAKGGPTVAEVGDIDSFGRNLKWLGVADLRARLDTDCSDADPEEGCQVVAAPAAYTPFAFEDLGRIELPARAANSMLCHWLSPQLIVNYSNPGAVPVVARLLLQPTLTVENPVLATPGLIDATTGLPFGGRLTASMTASEDFQVPLPPGTAFTERTRDSAVCIAGFLTRRSLVEFYGLSDAQAREFFRQPTTVRLNLAGGAQHIDFASLYFGLRIIGD